MTKNFLHQIIAFSLIITLLSINVSKAQIYELEGLNMPGSWNTWTNPPTNNVVLGNLNQVPGGQLNNVILGSQHYQTIFKVAATGGDIVGGTHQFKFSSGPNFQSPITPNIWNNQWGSNTAVDINTIESFTWGNGTIPRPYPADNSVTLTNGKWYTMNWENIGYNDNRAIFMETTNEPVEITDVTRTQALPAVNEIVTINVTLNAAKSSEEHIFVRYTKDNWTTSAIVEANFVALSTNGTATIPGQVLNTVVEYYVFSTTIANPIADYDLITIHYNNAGTNYNYTVGEQITCTAGVSLMSTVPTFPIENQAVTITFNAKLGNQGLMGYVGDVYAHTGVITNLSVSNSDWKHVIGTWGTNTTQPKLTKIGTDLYELQIPNIRTFYNLTSPTEIIQRMVFVFRSAAAVAGAWQEAKNADGSDILVEVYLDGQLSVKILSPNNQSAIIESTDIVPLCVTSLNATNLKVYIDVTTNLDSLIQTGVSDITFALNASNYAPGEHLLISVATNAKTEARDTIRIFIRDYNAPEPLPTGMKNGINYNTDGSVTLVLQDPSALKKYAFVIGEFNNWTPTNKGYMKRTADGKYYWLTITGLTPGKEYAYQYFIDGSLKIADAYCEKILDPWNDKWILTSTYPNLKPYPAGKTTGIVSILQTSKPEFNWQYSDNFIPAAQNATHKNLIIYELHIRDFVSSQAIKDVQAKLDYLENLGVNAIELMPINEFEGNDSWGYNPSFYFATDKNYGTENDYKTFIDACHERGIAVIIDMVLNHSYGQSPLVQMYMDASFNPSAQNPWYNQTSPNTSYSWGSDFNHESTYTKQFVKDVCNHWITEYKIDGFRFDFTKGFTNTPGEGYNYDQARINILTDYYNYIYSVYNNSGTRYPYVILEHLTDNSEETVLSNAGMMLWTGQSLNAIYSQATMGYQSNSDFSSAYYVNRGWTNANLIQYMECHDEQRVMYQNMTYGAYDHTLAEAIKHTKTVVPFFLLIPGPKMIWQFGELGYNVDINTPCRICPKPIHWEYYNDPIRYSLYDTYQAVNSLITTSHIFEGNNTTFNGDLSGLGKRMWLNNGDLKMVVIGNTGITNIDMQPSFQNTGTWYDYFSGQSFDVNNTSTYTKTLTPGEFHIYTNQYFVFPVSIEEQNTNNEPNVNIYPNPSNGIFTIEVDLNYSVNVYDLAGRNISNTSLNEGSNQVDLSDLKNGIYIIKFTKNDISFYKKIIINN